MKIAVRLFAAARELAGCAEVQVELPQGATVAHLRQELSQQHPAVAELAARSLLAVNAEYAADDAQLAHGDDVALIPPVSGG